MKYFKTNSKVLCIQNEAIEKEFQSLLSDSNLIEFQNIEESDDIYYFTIQPKGDFRRSFLLDSIGLMNADKEDISLLYQQEAGNIQNNINPDFLSLIKAQRVMSINLSHPNWKDCLGNNPLPASKPIHLNIVGLGDVGGTLLTGLKLTGGNHISTIGIYDKDENKMLRYEQEMEQIHFDGLSMPKVIRLDENDIFDCDVLAFTVATFIPPVGSEIKDVRMAQLEQNSKILKIYAKKAREAKFKGLFAILSDPVDQLCRVAYEQSNTDDSGTKDYLGLASDQIKGYGLGVMHARAVYHAKRNPALASYLEEGRAYGPHGKGLIIANSIDNYDEDLSEQLTQLALHSNLDVRATGFKPYIAPALSSGCLSLLATIRGDWHYSSVFIDGKFLGCKNRLTKSGVQIEALALPEKLINKLAVTFSDL